MTFSTPMNFNAVWNMTIYSQLWKLLNNVKRSEDSSDSSLFFLYRPRVCCSVQPVPTQQRFTDRSVILGPGPGQSRVVNICTKASGTGDKVECTSSSTSETGTRT